MNEIKIKESRRIVGRARLLKESEKLINSFQEKCQLHRLSLLYPVRIHRLCTGYNNDSQFYLTCFCRSKAFADWTLIYHNCMEAYFNVELSCCCCCMCLPDTKQTVHVWMIEMHYKAIHSTDIACLYRQLRNDIVRCY